MDADDVNEFKTGIFKKKSPAFCTLDEGEKLCDPPQIPNRVCETLLLRRLLERSQ